MTKSTARSELVRTLFRHRNVIIVLCVVSWLVSMHFQLQAIIDSDPLLRRRALLRDTEASGYSPPLESPADAAVLEEESAVPDQVESFSMPVVDIVSIGSVNQTDLQEAQQRTFGSHASVRNFIRMTEEQDAEPDCATKMDIHDVALVGTTCSNRERFNPDEQHPVLVELTDMWGGLEFLSWKQNPVGWMCAQKRPAFGLVHALEMYREEAMPDYLFMTDDDTWIHMDKVVQHLSEDYPASEAHIVTGCLLRTPLDHFSFSCPFGGYGTMMTRPVLENLLLPLHCSEDGSVVGPPYNDFTRSACATLSNDPIGERVHYRPGMSVVDLMYAYATGHPFLRVREWDNAGFCMHSDVYLAYWLNHYQLGAHTGDADHVGVLTDRISAYKGSTLVVDAPKEPETARECMNERPELCTIESSMCHHMNAEAMEKLQVEIEAVERQQMGGLSAT